ncbi:hypothetical protein B0H14DRAFT_1706443 [Mycena olivaceomarginata]|nr:hypothetical protein B0H14DRAFT_1706443 [Mycena olivaceomarginata]
MPSATSSTTPAGGTSKPRMSSRHSSRLTPPLPPHHPPPRQRRRRQTAPSRPAADARLPDVHKLAHTAHHDVGAPAFPPNLRPVRPLESLSVDRPSGKCGAHAARGSSPSATCRPFGPFSSLMHLRRLPRLIQVARWHSRRDIGAVGQSYRTRRRLRRCGCSIRRRRAIRLTRLLRRVVGERMGAVGVGEARADTDTGTGARTRRARVMRRIILLAPPPPPPPPIQRSGGRSPGTVEASPRRGACPR